MIDLKEYLTPDINTATDDMEGDEKNWNIAIEYIKARGEKRQGVAIKEGQLYKYKDLLKRYVDPWNYNLWDGSLESALKQPSIYRGHLIYSFTACKDASTSGISYTFWVYKNETLFKNALRACGDKAVYYKDLSEETVEDILNFK